MPVYEYQCQCGSSFDELILPGQKSKITTCPACGSEEFKKKISAFLRTKKCPSCSSCSNYAPKKEGE